ncbi:hypothetical protein E3U55_09055 [Filobacillus milosensis]|uniref:Uncharacterized protein n=1 Tax=Filobacillus milosensis TaxID=94137 RepID=A0A4Y8IN75_9BACI|nr:hypothetical protein [Filobacillus milosensis]TFB21449.1 hypothetical protein E3U55_09055 [Filobacillus milosensis]
MNNYVEQILSHWEGKPLEGAQTMIQKYGYPQEATMSRLTWYNNGPWKRTTIDRETVPHNFPTPHQDFLEQTIDYKVPIHLYDDVAAFDGSVYLDRTKGEASAKCHKEAMNFLSLNLLNDIVTGQRDVQGAKTFYAQTAYMFTKQNISSPYTEGLLFPKQFNTADPGIIYFR